MNKLKLLALLFLLCVGGKAFGQSLGMTYGYPQMPQIRSAAGAGGAKASAFPSPVIFAPVSFNAAGNNPTVSVPAGGATPAATGDCMVGVIYSTNITTFMTGVGAAVWSNFNWTSSVFEQVLTHYITAQDIAAGNFSLGINTGYPFGAVFVRHVVCVADAYSGGTAATTASNQPSSITTTLNGDLNVSISLTSISGAGYSYSPPAGYTNRVNMAPVSGVSSGVIIDTAQQTTAGALRPGAGTLGGTVTWGAVQIALPNDGGVY